MPIDYLAQRPRLGCDTETFPNLWAIGFRNVETKQIVKIKMTDDEPLDRNRIAKIMRNYRIYTFNGSGYDLPMIALAMSGASCADLKRANDDIIKCGLKSWEFYEKYGVSLPDFIDHVDLMEVAPSAAQRASLKKYAGMMHSRTMMEFQHDFDEPLDDDGIDTAMRYLDNDLEVTCDLIEELTPQIAIRAIISVDIGVDVRSKSDAQIGEAIIRQRVEKRLGGRRLYRPDIVPGTFKYEAPAYIKFQTPEMQAMLSRLLRSDFLIRRDGYVQLPEMFGAKKTAAATEDGLEFDTLDGGSEIIIGGNVYKMGIGGLHSQEESVCYVEDDEFVLIDADVTGYYPNLKLRSGREPANMRGHYLAVFKQIVDERAAAKKAGNKAKAEQGKIASNGLFGKTGSPYSIVYAPQMMIQTTVTGQLSLLMLIEEFTLCGWQVISANTDGVVTKLPRADLGMFRSVIFDWEYTAGLSMEETHYRAVYSRDVNNYMALKKEQGKGGAFTGKIEVKRKGVFAPSGRGIPAAFGLKKTPANEICYDAAVAFVLDGTPVETTIRNCQDIRKFVSVRNVKGGALKDGERIGKVVRYYYSEDSPGPLTYATNGNRVPRSDGAMPCMTLPEELPRDIDYLRYEREAYAILHECGLVVDDPDTRDRSGTYLGRREDQKTIHTINAATGVALCGISRKSRREPWVELESVPAGERHCGKCQKADEL